MPFETHTCRKRTRRNPYDVCLNVRGSVHLQLVPVAAAIRSVIHSLFLAPSCLPTDRFIHWSSSLMNAIKVLCQSASIFSYSHSSHTLVIPVFPSASFRHVLLVTSDTIFHLPPFHSPCVTVLYLNVIRKYQQTFYKEGGRKHYNQIGLSQYQISTT